jgi:CheY-like chemotaxis protein/HPt (histidine-containing phosphotransfer) domain-containing protein
MLLRLSRLSFWLAALAAAMALLAPIGHGTVLAAISSFACLFAVGLWRSVAKQAARELAQTHQPPVPPVVQSASLLDAVALLLCAVRDAPHPDLALHAAARVLRNELGAAQARVRLVHEVRDDHAILSDLTEAQPGFRTTPWAMRLGNSPAAVALRSGREAGNSPGDAAVPILHDNRVVALIVLEGIALPIEARALTGLLGLACLTLSQAAAATPALTGQALTGRQDHPTVLVVEDSDVQPEATARMLRGLGCRVSTAYGMLDGLNVLRRTQFDLILVDLQLAGMGATEGLARWRQEEGARARPAIALSASSLPGESERLRGLGFDDHLCKPFRQGQLLAMLNRHLPRDTQANLLGESNCAREDASGAAPGHAELDAGALARLTELDPSGQNKLVERVMQAFQTSVARLRPQLDTARESGDRGAVKLVAHTLKSSSASIGALRLSAVCADIETTLRLDPDADLGPRLDAMDTALDAALGAIDALLKGRA